MKHQYEFVNILLFILVIIFSLFNDNICCLGETATYVNSNNSNVQPITSDDYNIDYERFIVTGVSPGTSVSSFKKKFNAPNYSILVFDSDGKIKNRGNIGTGKSIDFIRDGAIQYTFKIIIYGDLNGNGSIGNQDFSILRNYLLGRVQLSTEFLIASDLNHDGEVNTIDLLCLRKYINGEYNIVQK